LSYPDGWHRVSVEEYALALAVDASGASGPMISLDIPDLPPHVPGLIPLGLVTRGYTDDLRKLRGESFRIVSDQRREVGGVTGQQIHSTWRNDQAIHHETALLAVHNDRVYILRATADAEHQTETLAAYEAVLDSIAWLR
jgi:hypothetical protein